MFYFSLCVYIALTLVYVLLASKMEKYLRKRYNDPSAPGSFQGPYKLYESAKRDGQNVSILDTKRVLEKEEPYTLNRTVRHNFVRNRVITDTIDTQWGCDLAVMSQLSKYNDKINYFMLCIDVFSRYAWVRLVKQKFAGTIIDSFKSIFKEGRKPKVLRTDGGREFNNYKVKAYLKSQGIHYFTTHNEKQANYSERCIKTIKSKLYRYMIKNNTLRYIDVLQNIVNSYNHTVHRSLGRPPAEVDKHNESEVRLDQYLRKPFKQYNQKYKFTIGDQVRIPYTPDKIETEYNIRWSGEVYTIRNRFKRNGIAVYQIQDWYDEKIDGTFYQFELQKVNVSKNDLFKVEKILKTRTRNGRKEVFVKFLHWPRKFSVWLPKSEVKDIS